jgi:hypothetical protein
MTHEEIDERNIAERYVLRTLPPDESARFEEHFVDCPDCQDRIETAERLRSGLKPITTAVPSRLPIGRAWPRMAWVSAAGVAMAAGVALFFFVQLATVRRQLEESRVESRDWRRRYDGLFRQPSPGPQPLVGATYYLSTTRDAQSARSEPVNRITLRPGLKWIMLSPEDGIDPHFRSLRASLKDSNGRAVWEQNELPVMSREALSVAVPTDLLHRGDYVLTLEGLAGSGRYLAVGVYRMRVEMTSSPSANR